MTDTPTQPGSVQRTEEPEPEQPAVVLSNWEFVNRVPTVDEVRHLLVTLPEVWGVATVDFIDYVQALPQQKKIKVPSPDNPRVLVEQYLDTYSLYMGVAGRIKMAQAAAEKNGWEVDFEPEPFTPTGVPGFISLTERIVYREYVVIRDRMDFATDGKERFVPLGRKPGTAWSPEKGGRSAEGSNPYEVVETSARGRALAAWGFGVLPGSGVASVEEIFGARWNEAAARAEDTGRARPPRRTRDDVLAETLMLHEELRQVRGITEDDAWARTVEYLRKIGVQNPTGDDGQIVWNRVKDGQVQLLANSLREALRKIRDEESEV